MRSSKTLITAVLVSASAFCLPASAGTLTTLANFSFGPAGGANPMSGALVYKGAIYGTTLKGGAYNEGLFYKLGKRQVGIIAQVTPIHSFSGYDLTPYDIVGPASEPELDGSILYGTGNQVADFSDPGIYQIDMDTGQETLVARFLYSEYGTAPNSVTLLNGLLYGTTAYDGGNANGTIFSVDPATSLITTLHAFAGGKDGATPIAGLTQVNGLLYGVTSIGGKNGAGTLFVFDPATNKKTILHDFDPLKEGTFPQANMIAVNGVLYGTTYGGGPANAGGVFSFDTVAKKATALHLFNGVSEGQNPQAPLLFARGHLLGSTSTGGAGGGGTLFAMDMQTGHESILHRFSGMDGAGPVGALHEHAGVFYGTTYAGGIFGSGTLFSYTP